MPLDPEPLPVVGGEDGKEHNSYAFPDYSIINVFMFLLGLVKINLRPQLLLQFIFLWHEGQQKQGNGKTNNHQIPECFLETPTKA